MTTPIIEWFVGPGETDNETFGAWLREQRHRAGLGRFDAAMRMHFTAEYLRLIERGKRTPEAGNMHTICDIYELVWERKSDSHWIIEGKSILFTAPILEAGRSKLPESKDDIPKPTNRLETLGWIIDRLTDVDELTLNQVKKLLSKDI